MTTELEDNPAPTGEVVTLDKLARVYIKMREKLAELTRTYETAEAAIKEQQAEVAAVGNWFEKIMTRLCTPFLSDAEVSRILKGAVVN